MWRAITEDDVNASLTGPTGTALRQALTLEGQADPYGIVVSQVVAEVRDAIRSKAGNRVHNEEGYVPESTIRHAVALIRAQLASRFAELMEVPKEWGEAAEAATEFLDKLASGDRQVEQPPADESAAVRQGSWNSENKIIPRTHPVPAPAGQYPSARGDYANPDAPADSNGQ